MPDVVPPPAAAPAATTSGPPNGVPKLGNLPKGSADDMPTAAAGASTAQTRPVLNGRPGATGNALRSDAPATKQSAMPSDILAVLKQVARQEPAAALRELQRLHGQLTGAAGSKALASLELSITQPGGGAAVSALDGAGGGGPGADGMYTSIPAPGGATAGTQSAITAQQRELNQLTIQRQRIQNQQREMRTELHQVTAELEKRKSELNRVTEQLKTRQKMVKAAGGGAGAGSPRPPSPPRGSPGAGRDDVDAEDSNSSDGAKASTDSPVARLPVGANGVKQLGMPAAAKKEGGSGDASEKKEGEDVESLKEELEDVRGDLQLTISDLRVILEATPAFVCAVDPHGHVSGWNTAAIEITGLRRDSVLQRHFVEYFVPQPQQQTVADQMESSFSLPADDPLANEPGEPFDLTLWRGKPPHGTLDSTKTITLRVRAYARRLGSGQPVGLLLIQDDAAANEKLRVETVAEGELVELNRILALREQELDEHEIELAALREELESFYREAAERSGRPLQPGAKPVIKPTSILMKDKGSSGQRIAWGAPNKVGQFTKGSSPREFGNKARHDMLREQAMGTTPGK